MPRCRAVLLIQVVRTLWTHQLKLQTADSADSVAPTLMHRARSRVEEHLKQAKEIQQDFESKSSSTAAASKQAG